MCSTEHIRKVIHERLIIMVKFKCKHTGNIYSYENDMDIKTMREHGEYEELKTEETVIKKERKVKITLDTED